MTLGIIPLSGGDSGRPLRYNQRDDLRSFPLHAIWLGVFEEWAGWIILAKEQGASCWEVWIMQTCLILGGLIASDEDLSDGIVG